MIFYYNQDYIGGTMENFIFISPDFPKNYDQFVRALKNVGFNVLGIGATPYHEISSSLKDNLTEY